MVSNFIDPIRSSDERVATQATLSKILVICVTAVILFVMEDLIGSIKWDTTTTTYVRTYVPKKRLSFIEV